jgi:hypothetical protein
MRTFNEIRKLIDSLEEALLCECTCSTRVEKILCSRRADIMKAQVVLLMWLLEEFNDKTLFKKTESIVNTKEENPIEMFNSMN